MGWTLTLAQCRKLYERHFGRDLPPDLPYCYAAEKVRIAVGDEEFSRMVDDIRQEEQDGKDILRQAR